jgi:hypothetical protein
MSDGHVPEVLAGVFGWWEKQRSLGHMATESRAYG